MIILGKIWLDKIHIEAYVTYEEIRFFECRLINLGRSKGPFLSGRIK